VCLWRITKGAKAPTEKTNRKEVLKLSCSPKIRQVIKFEGKGEHRNRREKEEQAKKLKSELDKAYKKIGNWR